MQPKNEQNFSDLGRRSVQVRRLNAVERRIQVLLDAAPPLSDEQRRRLAALLVSGKAA